MTNGPVGVPPPALAVASPPRLGWGAFLICAGIAPVAFFVPVTTSFKFAPLMTLGLLSYLATFVFAIRTLEYLRTLRAADDYSRSVRVKRVTTWVVIGTYAGLPLLTYVVFLVALAHSHLSF